LNDPEPAFTLFDLTGGNYIVKRTVLFSEFPASQLTFEADVTAVSGSEWSTKLTVGGTYDGPTDVISVRDYQLMWTSDGKTISENGSVLLVLTSGKTVQTKWTSTITPKDGDLRKFPGAGEQVNVTFSPFRIEGDRMSYQWTGTVGVLRNQAAPK
jgi:hypothetical protein